MSVQSDVILTPNSFDDDFLKRWLNRHLWGYPKLVGECPFSVLTDVRQQNLEAIRETIWQPQTIHSESARDASEGRPTEIPDGGDITQDPELLHPPHLRLLYTKYSGFGGEIVADRHSIPNDTEHTEE